MASTFGFLFHCLMVFFELTTVSECLQIQRMSVPNWVENGTKNVVLDCGYWFNPMFDTNLQISWYLNHELVYHWIPDRGERNAYGVMVNRLDWNYTAYPGRARFKYKALRILYISPEISGQYTCHVTSTRGRDAMMKNMTVYVPPHKFKVSYTEKNDSLINVICEALGVFPKPQFKMFMYTSSEKRWQGEKQQDTTLATFLYVQHNVTYDAYFYRTYNVSDLVRKNISWFECSFELVGPRYSHTKRFPYPVPPHELELSYNQTSDSTVHVMCEARGLFPFPSLTLLLESSSSGNLEAHNTKGSSELTVNYTYDTVLYGTFSNDELVMNGVSAFICVLELEGVTHSKSKRVPYDGAEASQLSGSLKPTIPWYLLTASFAFTNLYSFGFSIISYLKKWKRSCFFNEMYY